MSNTFKDLPPSASQWRKPPIASPKEFAQLQRRAAELGKTLPSDQTLANSQELLQALPRSCLMPADPADAVQARQAIAKKAEDAQQKSAAPPPPQQPAPQPQQSQRSAVPAPQPTGQEVTSTPAPAPKQKTPSGSRY